MSQQSAFLRIKFVSGRPGFEEASSQQTAFATAGVFVFAQQSSMYENDTFPFPLLRQTIELMVIPRLEKRKTNAKKADVIFCAAFILQYKDMEILFTLLPGKIQHPAELFKFDELDLQLINVAWNFGAVETVEFHLRNVIFFHLFGKFGHVHFKNMVFPFTEMLRIAIEFERIEI